MPLSAVYGAVYATATRSKPAGKIDSAKKALNHLEDLPLLLTSDSLESMSAEGKWLPRFVRRAILRSVTNRIAGLILVGSSAFLTSCIATLDKEDATTFSVIETLFWRSLICWLFTAGIIATTGTELRIKKELQRPLIFRCIMECTSTMLAILVLEKLAVANATAISYFHPLLALAMANYFLKENPGWFMVVSSMLCVAGAVLVVRPAFLFGKNASTDVMWYHRSTTSVVTSYLFGESLVIACAVVVSFMQAGAFVLLRSLHKLPYLVVMHYFFLSMTLLALAVMLGIQHDSLMAGMSLKAWSSIAGTSMLAFAEQVFLTRGFHFDDTGVLAATQLLHVGCEFAWGVVLLGTAFDTWSACGTGVIAGGVFLMGLRRMHSHWAARRSMR